MDYTRFRQQLEHLRDTYAEIVNEDDWRLILGAPATEQEVRAVEAELGLTLPRELREFLLRFSGNCEFMVYPLPKDLPLPEELCQIFSAELVVALKRIRNAEMIRRDWVDGCFDDPNDEYDRVWHNKLGLIKVRNGDIIALDIGTDAENPPVVYLSHDEGDGHGCVLGRTLEEYLENLVLIGACGNEDWQLLPFIPDAQSGIDPNCDNAVTYRALIGLDWNLME